MSYQAFTFLSVYCGVRGGGINSISLVLARNSFMSNFNIFSCIYRLIFTVNCLSMCFAHPNVLSFYILGINTDVFMHEIDRFGLKLIQRQGDRFGLETDETVLSGS